MLRQQLLQAKEYFETQKKEQENYVFFLSHFNGTRQAITWQTRAPRFLSGWNKVERYISKLKIQPEGLTIQMVCSKEAVTPEQLAGQMKETKRKNYFRKGIAFDKEFYLALTEAELNGNGLYLYDGAYKGAHQFSELLNGQHTQNYLARKSDRPVFLNVDQLSHVYVFDTTGVFIQGNQCYILQDKMNYKGVRQIPKSELRETIGEVILNGEHFIQRQQQHNGKFIYGYYPALNRVLINYNAVRHFSTIYAWIEAIDYLNLPEKLAAIQQSIDWGIQELTLEKDGALFVIEKQKDESIEIKLGSNAMALLTLTKYVEYSGDERYESQMTQLYQGIRRMYNDAGASTHVFDGELKEKEKFRIVYYEGEALFALTKYYQYSQNAEVLQFIQRVFQRLIDQEYYKNHDHWLSYATNQLLMVCPEPAYAEFGIKNVMEHLAFIEQRDTAYPTLLELLVSSRKMMELIQTNEQLAPLVTQEEVARLDQVMHFRAYHELSTGVFFPEVAMYFPMPNRILGGFFARHDNFRTRIDDAEHFLSGLINFAELTDQLIIKEEVLTH